MLFTFLQLYIKFMNVFEVKLTRKMSKIKLKRVRIPHNATLHQLIFNVHIVSINTAGSTVKTIGNIYLW